MKHWFVSCLGALALVSAGGCSRGPGTMKPAASSQGPAEITIAPDSQKAANIVVAPALQRSVPLTIQAVGALTLNQYNTEHVGVVFPGTVTRVLATVGDRVQAHQVLAFMHSHDLHDAVASYQSARAEAAFARTVRDRYQKLYEIQYASREEAERSELQYKKALAALTAARAHLAGMLQVPERGLDGLDVDSDAMPIKTPRAGVVIVRLVTPGMALQPGSETFTVSNLSSLWMIASVSENDVHAVHTGQPVTISVRAYPNERFAGRVDMIGPQLDPATRMLPVRVLVPNRDGRLRPDMFATAYIDEGGSRTSIFVPDVAVQDMNGNPVVFVRHGDSTFEARPVRTGLRDNGLIEVQSGLRQDELVVSKGAFVVKSQFLIRALSQE